MTDAPVAIRPMRPADLEAMAAILAEPSVARWWGPYDRARAARELLGEAETVVVEHAGAPCGLVMIGEEDDPEFRHATLDIAIASAHRGRGVGRAALGQVVAMLAARGHHRITIDPARENAAAVRCYAAVGFREVGVLRMYQRMGDGRWHDGLLMELVLPGPGARSAGA